MSEPTHGRSRRNLEGFPGPAPWRVVLAALVITMPACGDPAPDEGQRVETGEPVRSEPSTEPAETTGPGRPTEPEGPTELVDTAASAGDRVTGFDTVFAYFTDAEEAQVPVPRGVPDTAHALQAAFIALLAGPTAEEREAGLQSWFSDDTAGMLRGISVEDGFAVVDFEDLRPVIPNAAGSAGALMLLGELTATAFQFPEIRRVEFRIDGDCETLMAWLQFDCYPIRRGEWDAPPRFRDAVRP